MTLQTTSTKWFDEAAPFDAYLEDIIARAAESVSPKEDLNVAQAAERYRIMVGGGVEGEWDNRETPYLVEPMEEMTNRLYESVIFVGPSQCGKTELFLNWLTWTVMCSPADMMLVQTAMATARDFSMRRIDRMHKASKDVGNKVLVDNTYDKQYASGMICQVSWPSSNELSGKPIPRVFETDYDRMTQDVDGEGTPYVLGKARITSFKKRGKIVVESSPGFPIKDPQWTRRGHEAPPAEGILSLYNAGDRRRWYWRCVRSTCRKTFEPTWELMEYPDSEDPLEAGEMARLRCPHCNLKYSHDFSNDAPGKSEMNAEHARWIKEGQLWMPNGSITGEARRANSASFFLEGVCAAFAKWSNLVIDYRAAQKTLAETGSEEELKTVTNTKLGRGYLPQAQAQARLADEIAKRASTDWGEKVVPFGARFLVATIDAQTNRFEVMITAVGAEDVWIIDRFPIKYSKREDPAKAGQFLPIDPGANPEDWRHILYEVMQQSYPLQGDETRHMSIYMTFCDSAGKEGFTRNAYSFYRWLGQGYSDRSEVVTKEQQELYPWQGGFQQHFQLTKGESTPSAASVKITYPDAQRKDRFAGARGDVPVMFINTTTMKNHVDGVLNRLETGGRVNFPKWLPHYVYKELTTETKNPKTGLWENLTGHRNESWDLLVYLYAGLLHPRIHWEHIPWDDPDPFAADWANNSFVYSIETEVTPFEEAARDDDGDLEELGRMLND
jgi:phage terminase large subunit GpA-like protein